MLGELAERVAHKGPPWKLADPKIPHHVISDAFTTQRYRQKCQCFLVKFVGDRISSMEKQLYVGQQKILFDREATVALYRQTIMIPGADAFLARTSRPSVGIYFPKLRTKTP
jgi:hypothetical protein